LAAVILFYSPFILSHRFCWFSLYPYVFFGTLGGGRGIYFVFNILQQYLESFQSLGFELQVIGPNSIALRGVPQEAWGREKEILYGILDELLTNKGVPDLYGPALNVISCKQAVKAGTRLSTPEMAKIISSLLALDDYGHCPHGRPTIIRLSYEDLERMFKRR
jgi:DNA mismatch repair protein MutL